MKQLLKIVLIVFALTAGDFSIDAAEPTDQREWTATGGYKVTASAVFIDGGKVVLKRKNGKTVKVPMSKLITADQELLKKHFAIEETTPEELKKVKTGEPASDLPHPLGATTAALECGGHHYFIYLPKSLRNGEVHPVIFVMDPGGGKANTASRYIAGAEKNRWIIAVSKESKNGNQGSEAAINAMIKEVTKKSPRSSQ